MDCQNGRPQGCRWKQAPRKGMTMRLYYIPGASSLFPHIILREVGFQFVPIKVDERSSIH
jgi:hypothetical protein